VSDGLGVRFAEVASVRKELVSTVNAVMFASDFFDDWLPIRNMVFHAGVPVLGPEERLRPPIVGC